MKGADIFPLYLLLTEFSKVLIFNTVVHIITLRNVHHSRVIYVSVIMITEGYKSKSEEDRLPYSMKCRRKLIYHRTLKKDRLDEIHYCL